MAFCNSCGTALPSGTNFCSKCGTPVAGGAPPPAASAAPTDGGGALKVVMIVVIAVVAIGVICVATLGLIGYHMAKNSRVTEDGDRVKVETPFGTFSAHDPEQAVRDLGVEVYPGAEAQKNGASSVTVAGIRTVTASFESSDSLDNICSFYKSKFPNSSVTTSDQNRCTIVSNDRSNMVTIKVEASGDRTRFQIANVSKKAASSN
jgi:hypothetical protein